MRTLKELGIATVAVYSEADADAPHVRHADEAYEIGPAPADRELPARRQDPRRGRPAAGVDAIHPGYGFLAENAAFARACADAGIVFIGPPPEAIEAMGSKIRARETMRAAGVPIVPGTTAPGPESSEAAADAAAEIGYPVAMKAAGGGGGKGFRVAHAPDELEKAFDGASGEGERFFGDPTVYVERYLEDPRHVEVQILADGHGNVIHLGERDCSIQRRHQKLIEECPAPGITAELRERIASIGVEAARAVGYRGAGTVEGLLAGRRVLLPRDEHPRAGRAQRHRDGHRRRHRARADRDRRRRAALARAGGRRAARPRDRVPHQRRGRVEELRSRAGRDRRATASRPARSCASTPASRPAAAVLPYYDPMIAKLIVWDRDREAATRRMLRALDEYEIEGLKTLLPFHRALLQTEQWANGETCRDLIGDRAWLKGLGSGPGRLSDLPRRVTQARRGRPQRRRGGGGTSAACRAAACRPSRRPPSRGGAAAGRRSPRLT